jgi:hypothetical protein
LESVVTLQNVVKQINEVVRREVGERITIRSILEGGIPEDEEEHHDESEADEHTRIHTGVMHGYLRNRQPS